jgi:hypothetical protein
MTILIGAPLLSARVVLLKHTVRIVQPESMPSIPKARRLRCPRATYLYRQGILARYTQRQRQGHHVFHAH